MTPGARSRRLLTQFSRCAALVCLVSIARADQAPLYKQPLPELATLLQGPAMKYANLSPGQCRTQLQKERLPHRRVYGGASGIATPLRIDGPLHEVGFRTAGPKSKFSLLDCRLLLTLDELAAILAKHGVSEIQVDNLYRPHAHLPGKKRGRSQHAYGLAMDVTAFTLKDGRRLVVEDHFNGKLGEAVCGADAQLHDETPEALALRNLVCDIAQSGLFHNVLTPNHNTAHHNHLHLDIKRGAKWFGVH